jgi:hypothetical protein
VSTADLVYAKTKDLPERLQLEALSFVDYLGRRRTSKDEAAKWDRLFRQTQSLASAQRVPDEAIAAEIAAFRGTR